MGYITEQHAVSNVTVEPCYQGAVVAQWIRPRTLNHEVPGSNLGSGSSALWQGTLSSLPSPSERT